MAHLVEKMAYVGETPWHGLGNKLTRGASRETWKVESGLDFHVHKVPVMFSIDGVMHQHDSRHVLVRDDTNSALGIVSDGYRVVQTEEVIGFFDDLCSKNGFELETAGSLNGGKRVWAMCKVAEGVKIIGNDIVNPYVLMTTSFDGSLATTAKITAIRVVCNNTLTLATTKRAEGGVIRVPHSATFDAKQAKIDLGIIDHEWKRFTDQAMMMAEIEMDGYDAHEVLMSVLSDEDDEDAEIKLVEKPAYKRIMNLFAGAAIGSELTQGRTLWQFVNSVTQFVDHERGASRDARLRNAWFGQGDKIKRAVWAKAAELIG
jgi:phage/plasmid-like protein (TIGR03299 family)